MTEPLDEPWMSELDSGRAQAAWDAFIERYRRLIFASIRHYAADHDDVMDIFACVCEALRRDDLRRLRAYRAQGEHRARFSTWLVTVVRHLAVDWFRARDGRRRVTSLADALPPLERRIFELVFVDGYSHVEAFERLRAGSATDLTFRAYQAALRSVYGTMTTQPRGLMLPGHARRPADQFDDREVVPDDVIDRSAILERAFADLKPEDRLAVELYVIEELPAADVARVLGLAGAKSVYNKVYRALDSLRARLRALGLERNDL